MAADPVVEVGYRFIRYSGKEMDISGLYCYGARYYAPWLQRWISADPAGEVDGLNLYAFVGNDPIGHVDVNGKPGCRFWTRSMPERIASLLRKIRAMPKMHNALQKSVWPAK